MVILHYPGFLQAPSLKMSKIPRTWILGLLGLTGIKNWLTSLSLLNVFLGKRFCCSHCYRAAKRNQQGTENHKYKLCSPACEPTCRSKTFLFKLKYLAREQRVSFLFRLQANQLLALLWVAVVTTQASVSVYTASQHGHTISHQTITLSSRSARLSCSDSLL